MSMTQSDVDNYIDQFIVDNPKATVEEFKADFTKFVVAEGWPLTQREINYFLKKTGKGDQMSTTQSMAEIDADSALFITKTAEQNPTYKPADFSREYEATFGGKPSKKEVSFFIQTVEKLKQNSQGGHTASSANPSGQSALQMGWKKYAFRVTCKDGRSFYGRTDKDVSNVCNEGDGVYLYSSETGNIQSISKGTITVFEFGACSVTEIDMYFLCGFSQLTTSPTLPSTVTKIWSYFMRSCASVTTPPVLPSSVTEIDGNFMCGCVSLTTPPIIPRGVTHIWSNFLRNCSSLRTAPVLPPGVTDVEMGFLSGCSSLTAPPAIPRSVKLIGGEFLADCTALTVTPQIPDSVTVIGDYFLFGCTSLTTPPVIPTSVKKIGKEFLYGCTKLKR